MFDIYFDFRLSKNFVKIANDVRAMDETKEEKTN